MNTTYRVTRHFTQCPFSGLHHAEGHLLVLDNASLSFFSPAEDGTPGNQLTDPRPLKSDADREYVKGWLESAVKAGTLVDLAPPAKRPPSPNDPPAPRKAPAAK